jgi:hypothetical protein
MVDMYRILSGGAPVVLYPANALECGEMALRNDPPWGLLCVLAADWIGKVNQCGNRLGQVWCNSHTSLSVTTISPFRHSVSVYVLLVAAARHHRKLVNTSNS